MKIVLWEKPRQNTIYIHVKHENDTQCVVVYLQRYI